MSYKNSITLAGNLNLFSPLFSSPIILFHAVISTIGEISWFCEFASWLLHGQEISPIVEMTNVLKEMTKDKI
ncbi:hypothetical protein N824_00235 [Pedobacter sp. V48]|nr:hypothetical protein N824_00235 [Pedobacter sp. V48]